MNAQGMATTIQRSHIISSLASEYCRQFHRRVTSSKPPNVNWPTDLHVPFTDFADLAIDMDGELQVFVGLSALDQVATSSVERLWGVGLPRRFHKLREEI